MIMGQLGVFNFTTLNGFFNGPGGDLGWHQHGREEGEFAAESMKPGGILLFGRTTYDMMASVWPTEQGKKNNPAVAEGMNNAEKIVFSRKMKKADWNNTKVVHNMEEEIRQLKKTSGKDLTILGSGSIVTQLAELGLIDRYMIMVDPVALGSGTPMFKGLEHPLKLKLKETRTFKSGVILLNYEPA